ncbi:MAG: gluconate 2-dehydrogenase gamma chain [Actinomycetota bacterium]|nr:gluconate 2-dehydrogenase gamma chain [Actinomycetota bacterium]
MPNFLTDHEHAVVSAAADRLIPPVDAHPGGAALGVADYVDNLLGAFTFDPPLIFAGGPFSGRFGGEASFSQFMPLSPNEEIAWRTRVEGSRGLPGREFNGPTRGWQDIYRAGIAALGDDFCSLVGDEQDRRLHEQPELRRTLYVHACEGAYGAPEYGGNRALAGWHAIGFEGDVQPRGYTDDEVTRRA